MNSFFCLMVLRTVADFLDGVGIPILNFLFFFLFRQRVDKTFSSGWKGWCTVNRNSRSAV